MADGTLFCDKSALYAASKEASTIGDGVNGQVHFGRAACVAAADGHAGFRIRNALRAAVSVWERNVTALAEQITGVSTKLRETADAYQVADTASADRFHTLHVN